MDIKYKLVFVLGVLILGLWVFLPILFTENVGATVLRFSGDRLASIRNACGELCNTTRKASSGPFFDYVTANINCNALLKNEYIDRQHGLPHAPKHIPTELKDEFTMNNRLTLIYGYYDQQYLGEKQ